MDAILSLRDISKDFSGVKALEHVDLDIYPGEVHALVGENGAGKSTLMKIISSVYKKSSGRILLKGKEVDFRNTDEAKQNGIAIIHQEFNLFPNLSVAENIFMDTVNQKNPENRRRGKIFWKKVYRQAAETIGTISNKIDVSELVGNLNVQSKQVVEIAKAIHAEVEILIMDEPSAALPEHEVENMFQVVRRLKEKGVAIIYVSHHLDEVFKIADKITVLRNGRKVDTVRTESIDHQGLIRMMIGSEIKDLYSVSAAKENADTDILAEAKNLTFGEKGKVSFKLHRGEIVSLFGIVGSGTQSVSECLFGLREYGGQLFLEGKEVTVRSPRQAIRAGIGYIPGDRRKYGIVKERSVEENITLPILKDLAGRLLVIDRDRERQLVENVIEKLRVKTTGPKQITNFLSGGNQQKVVIAKWLSINPKILVMVEPTRGVDIGAMAEIYELIHQLADRGLGILLISSDMPEVLGMSDRILVMRSGKIVKEFPRGSVTQTQLLHEITKSEEGQK